MKKLAILLVFFIFCGCGKVPSNKISESGMELKNAAVPTEAKIHLIDNAETLSKSVINWGLQKNPGRAPGVDAYRAGLLKKYGSYYMGDPNSKDLFLTFDEGYENGYTEKILDVLKKHHVPAAFFVTGPYLKTEKALIKRMVEEGHIVANHTVNHPSMPEISDKELEEELLNLDRSFYEDYGVSMKYVRPPKGEYSEKSLYLTHELGYTTVMWSFAYEDWYTNRQKGADFAYKQVMDYLHGGEIILLHAVSADNAGAMERIITDARAMGFVFKSLDELPEI